jgi:hypothetical protein
MKTKTIFYLWLFLGMVAFQLSAQGPVLVRAKSDLAVNIPPDLKNVNRNVKQVESVKDKVTTYDVLRFKHRKLFWEKQFVFVEPTSHKAEGVFAVKENDHKQDRKKTTPHFYLIGKSGVTFIGKKKD